MHERGVPDVPTMSQWDVMLAMTSPEIAKAAVEVAIARGSPEDRGRLAAAIKGRHVSGLEIRRVLQTYPEYRMAMSLICDLVDSDDPEAADVIISLNQFVSDLAQHAAGDGDGRPTFEGLDGIRRRYLPRRSVPQKGGGVPDDISDMDINFYRVMQLGDAIHDFADDENEDLRETLLADLGAVLPNMHVPIVKGASKTHFRKPTLAEIADKEGFVEFMTLKNEVKFGDAPVQANPLHGKSFEKGMYRHVHGTKETNKVGYKLVDGYKHHYEIFCHQPPEGGLTLLRLIELVDLREKIRAAFALPDGFKFVADQNALPGHPGVARSLPFMIAWLLGFKNTIDQIMNFHQVVDAADDNFGVLCSCDASLHDGAKFRPSLFSEEETGVVFHELSMVTLRFDKKPTDNSYGFVLESTSGCPLDIFDLTSKRKAIGYDVEIRKNGFKYATDRDTGVPKILSTSSESMGVKIAEFQLAKLNVAVALALKLAGDWGQIEHCKKLKNAVFVTCDKLAALYAVYRDVPMMYVNHHDHFMRGRDGTLFLHYSFVMMDRKDDTVA